jgi:hypothetical protein
MKSYWKVFCEETEFPGLWPRWYKSQCVAVGWRPKNGQTLEGETDDKGWAAARKAIKSIKAGDMIVVQLRNHRVGRVGEVVRKAIGDGEWNPTVPPSKESPHGGKGRRIEVRWDLNIGPPDPETVVLLPTASRLSVVRPTICRIDSTAFDSVVKAMKDDANWVGLHGRFDRERSLSDYIATYPFRLEDSLMPYPDKKVRENAFEDKTRTDVLLIDRDGTPVVVECKQGAPTLENIKQLRGYMKHIHHIAAKRPRGILVHGGAASLRDEVRKEVALDPLLRVIRYSLLVDFVPCT